MILDVATQNLEVFLQELEEDCIRYLELRAKLRRMDEGEAKEDTEADLAAHVTQIASSAEQAEEALLEFVDSLPNED